MIAKNSRLARPAGLTCLGLWAIFLLLAAAGECSAFSSMLGAATNFVGDSIQRGVSMVVPTGDEQPEASRKQSAKGRSIDDDDDDDDDGDKKDDARSINDDFESQCLLNRGASFSSEPLLYFFSTASQNSASNTCETPEIIIPLGLDEGQSLGDDPNGWRLDRSAIGELLLASGAYNSSWPSYMLVHGFMASWNSSPWQCRIKDEILAGAPAGANVFIVDWSGGSQPTMMGDYGQAVANTKYVGQLIAKFITDLLAMSNQQDASRFHLIGHSLGAHISGFVGYALNGMSLGRITGLDPAGPCFTSNSASAAARASETGELAAGALRLSPQCADLVVAIHTDAGRFGLNENCAHYDVYVNGGDDPQPNCHSLTDRVDCLFKMKFMDAAAMENMYCSHLYAHHLTDATNEQCHLTAHRCSSWRAFKRGECGLLGANQHLTMASNISEAIDALATNPELNGVALAAAALERRHELAGGLEEDSSQDYGDYDDADRDQDDDDERVNGEEDPAASPLQAQIARLQITRSANKRNQHFLATSLGNTSSTCVFAYQLVVGAEPLGSDEDGDEKFYLDIPLDKQPGLATARSSGGRALDRIVQVSHKLRRTPGQSPGGAHARLASAFEPAHANSEGLQFYTALVTFDAASDEECRQLSRSKSPQTERKRWYLCEPISADIGGLRLWAADRSALERVKLVAMAYLSGANAAERQEKSFLFEPDLSGLEKGSPEKGASMKMTSDDSIAAGLLGQFSTVVNRLQGGRLSSNDASSNLKFSTPLKAVSADKRRQAIKI